MGVTITSMSRHMVAVPTVLCAVVTVLGIVAGRVVAHCFFFLEKYSGRMDWFRSQYQLSSVLTRTPLTYSYHSQPSQGAPVDQ